MRCSRRSIICRNKGEKISLLRATGEVKQTPQETEMEREKKQSSIMSRVDDLETKSPRRKVGQPTSFHACPPQLKTSSTVSSNMLWQEDLSLSVLQIYFISFISYVLFCGEFFLDF